MKKTHENPVDSAIDYMEKARQLLLEQISSPDGLSANIAESLDLLDCACTYAGNPENNVLTCPLCGSIYNEPQGLGYTCLCCDHPWIPAKQ